jgi:cobalt-zinc-cadmium efflux system membrane fusion protein
VKPAAIVLATFLILGGCRQDANPNAPQESDTTSNATPEASVELSPSQLNAIKIEPVGTYRFPVEKEAVGSISFDEDPATVQAESALVGAAATFDLTGKTLARAKDLAGATGGVAQKELEQAASDYQTAEAALTSARDAVRALGKTDAEIDRMISAGKIESTPAGKWAVANVTESDSPLFRVGLPVTIKVMAHPDRVFEGKVSRTYATVDPNTHRVTIRCEIADPQEELRAGMLANVVFRIQDPVEATALPANGVVRESDGTMTAWVTTDRHRFQQRILKLGLQADGRCQILDGLQRGELAVTDGAVFLSNMLNAPPSD